MNWTVVLLVGVLAVVATVFVVSHSKASRCARKHPDHIRCAFIVPHSWRTSFRFGVLYVPEGAELELYSWLVTVRFASVSRIDVVTPLGARRLRISGISATGGPVAMELLGRNLAEIEGRLWRWFPHVPKGSA